MRLIDADELFDKVLDKWATEIDAETASHFMDMINDAPTIREYPNEPLTLDYLRMNDNTPVWVSIENGVNLGYGIINARKGCVFGRDMELTFGCYGEYWLAYRRNPKDEEK